MRKLKRAISRKQLTRKVTKLSYITPFILTTCVSVGVFYGARPRTMWAEESAANSSSSAITVPYAEPVQEKSLERVYEDPHLEVRESMKDLIKHLKPLEGELLYSKEWIWSFGQELSYVEETALRPGFDSYENHMIHSTLKEAYSLISYLCSDDELIKVIAKITTAEIGGLDQEHAYSSAEMEQAAVVWCILNNAEEDYSETLAMPFTSNHTGAFSAEACDKISACIIAAAKVPNRFAYRSSGKIFEGQEELAVDILCRWVLEKWHEDLNAGRCGVPCEYRSVASFSSGRVLPLEYRFFCADGSGWHNRFRNAFNGAYRCWDWSLTDPYRGTEGGDN